MHVLCIPLLLLNNALPTGGHDCSSSLLSILFKPILSLLLPLPTSASAVNLLGDMSHVPLAQLEEMGVGLNVGIQWEEALHAALMPITPQCSMGSLAESETHTHVTTTALYATECAIACIYMYLCFGHQCSIYHGRLHTSKLEFTCFFSILCSWAWSLVQEQKKLHEGFLEGITSGQFPWQPCKFVPRGFHPGSTRVQARLVPGSQTRDEPGGEGPTQPEAQG